MLARLTKVILENHVSSPVKGSSKSLRNPFCQDCLARSRWTSDAEDLLLAFEELD
jgi:hypothetical protein